MMYFVVIVVVTNILVFCIYEKNYEFLCCKNKALAFKKKIMTFRVIHKTAVTQCHSRSLTQFVPLPKRFDNNFHLA